MAEQRQKKNRFYKNLKYRFYCRDGYLPIEETKTVDSKGKEFIRKSAILKLQPSKYLKNIFPDLKYCYSGVLSFIEDNLDSFPFLDFPSQKDIDTFIHALNSGFYDWNDIRVRQVASFLLAQKVRFCNSSELPYSLSPNKIRDYEKDLILDSNLSKDEIEVLMKLKNVPNPFLKETELLKIEIPLSQCTVEDGRVKYFTIQSIDDEGNLIPYYLISKMENEKRKESMCGLDVILSLRETFDDYIKGKVKDEKGKKFYDYSRIVPIGTDRDFYAVDINGVAKIDYEAYSILEYEKSRIQDKVLADNLEFNWQAVAKDCKKWMAKPSKKALAKSLGDFNKIYLSSYSLKLYPTNILSLAVPSMINGQYDKLNYNMFMLDSGFECYSRGQIEIDADGYIMFVHYIKEDIMNLYPGEEPRDIRQEERYGKLLSRSKSVQVIKDVDAYQGRSIDNAHFKPHEYGYKDKNIIIDSDMEINRSVIVERIDELKGLVDELKNKKNNCDLNYLIPIQSKELCDLMERKSLGELDESETIKLFNLTKDYYDDILEIREKGYYWYVDLSKVNETLDFEHIDKATKNLFDILISNSFILLQNDVMCIEEEIGFGNRYSRATPVYRIVDSQTIKIMKDIIYRKHMEVAEGKYQLKSEREGKNITKKNK